MGIVIIGGLNGYKLSFLHLSGILDQEEIHPGPHLFIKR